MQHLCLYLCNILSVNTFGRTRAKKVSKEEAEKEIKKEKVINETKRHKPYGKTAREPVDDVYVMKHYTKTTYNATDAIELLKKFQKLDFTSHSQPVYVNLKLDMKLEKKVKIPITLY